MGGGTGTVRRPRFFPSTLTMPAVMYTDRGSEYCSRKFKRACRKPGIDSDRL